jgi:hypothetical protein
VTKLRKPARNSLAGRETFDEEIGTCIGRSFLMEV